MDFVTDFLDALFQIVYLFVQWDWKIAMMTFLLIGHLVGRNQQPESEPEYSK